jgi:hypothetical protein
MHEIWNAGGVVSQERSKALMREGANFMREGANFEGK